MGTTIIIPARYASTRLPGKPLLDRTGKPLIQHVVENARESEVADRVVVATDDNRIFDVVTAFGGEAVMTSEDHTSGTDRLAEATKNLGLPDDEIIVNVQGDEPDIPPQLIARLVSLIDNTDSPMATLCTEISSEDANDPNKVKVVMSETGNALYFSRSKIPFDRDDEGTTYHLHMGIYAYRCCFLNTFTSLKPTSLEQTEKLEQLRAIENGHTIAIAVVDYNGSGIDTPEDYTEFVEKMAE